MGLRKIDAAPQRPEINNVANKYNMFRPKPLQEIFQGIRMAACGAQMHVGQKFVKGCGRR